MATLTTADVLADAVLSCRSLIERFLVGFDDANATRQAPGLKNHPKWVLGHLALYQHRAAEMISNTKLDLGWDPEPFAFNSEPVDDPAQYPPLETVKQAFLDSLERLAEVVRAMDEALQRDLPWGAGQIQARNLIARMIFHAGTHTGQVLDLRRALGMARVM